MPEKANMNQDLAVAMANGSPIVTLRTGALQIELVRMRPGELRMGSPNTERGHAANEQPTRGIRISKPFYLGRFEITRGQYRAVAAESPAGTDDDALPVCQITYADAQAFCRLLSRVAQVETRLPTEAEWEYACRAGTQTPYYSGTSEADLAGVGWYSKNSEGKPHPVGQKQANPWGLYDMHGNVWEYCVDFIENYATMATVDPVGALTLGRGAMRGGGWMHDAEMCRAAARLISDDMFGGAGFRIAISTGGLHQKQE